jgi:hypothetical protein
MNTSNRFGFVQFQQRLARMALARREFGAARAALRVLRTSDFFGGAVACEGYFAVLRDHRSTEAEIREAIAAIIALRPAGAGVAP